MKKILLSGLLAISFIASAQSSQSNHLSLETDQLGFFENDIQIEKFTAETIVEEDAPFEFDTQDYLPLGFNPNTNNQYADIYEVSIIEKDVPFEFNTKDYLPVGFDPYANIEYANIYEATIEEQDAPFNFNTNDYLPLGFDAYLHIDYNNIYEVFVVEEDAPFDFNTNDYLPVGFDPYHEMVHESNSHVDFPAYPTI